MPTKPTFVSLKSPIVEQLQFAHSAFVPIADIIVFHIKRLLSDAELNLLEIAAMPTFSSSLPQGEITSDHLITTLIPASNTA
ncbi:hypothetical protein, partial [Arsukibacterium sp.]|uniref:hypothetical protein n=1 Tax=Arsukibacterium sp. TaxID=1977258 RepID=UPI002FD8D2FB